MNGQARVFPVVSGWVAAAVVAAAAALATAQDDVDLLEQKAFQTAVDRAAPSVVCIETVGGLERMGRVLFGTGPTTGLVVEKDGYLVSSAFNFVNKPASILVRMADGTRKPAKLVATDHNRMLVLLKIEVDKPLPVPEIVPQSEIRVGQWAIAVGRAFGTSATNSSVGVLSAVNRIWGKAIQTDAAVSPNNYGGPLLDVRGRVLGVLVPLSPDAATEVAGVEWYDSGIGFAVPAEHVWKILPRLKKGEDLRAGVIGINFRQPNLHTGEPEIGTCRPNSPAAKAGLKAGDKFEEIEGVKITRAAQVKEEISRRYAGDKLHVVVLRDKKRIECDVEMVAELQPYQRPFAGILPMRTSAGEHPPGTVVRFVYPDSPAAKAGIEPVDLVVALNGKPVKDRDELRQRIGEHEPGADVEVELRRGSESRKVKVKLGQLPEAIPAGPLPPARVSGRPSQGKKVQVGSIQVKVPEFTNDAWAYVPEGYDPAVPHGIVLWLHAAGGFDEKEVIARWKPFCDANDLILLAPKAKDPERWQPNEVALVRKLLDNLHSSYAIDPTRTAAVGYQQSGTLAFAVAFAHPGQIQAVAAVEAPLTAAPQDNDPAHLLTFYVARSAKSEHAAAIDQAVNRLRAMKFAVAVKDLGEKPRDLKPEELSELLRLIDTLDRI
jgi:serine protease Do